MLFNAHPEWAPDSLVWMRFPGDIDTPKLKQATRAWFSPLVIHGTAYGAMRNPGASSDAQIGELYAMAPLQIVVAQTELKRLYGDHYTIDQYRKVMGPLLDYEVEVIDDAKNATDLTFDQRVQLAEQSAAINPDSYYDLAQLYVDNHKDDKAAAAYQEWFDKGTDRVGVANGMEWLVNYYYDHGQSDKAMAIASNVAEVYSYRGLETMMHLQEKMGHLDEAESYGQKINERYNDSSPLAQLYARQAAKGQAGYQAKFDAAAASAFPQGMKKVTLATFSAPPTVGTQFVETNDAMSAAGLSSDQVIVALDGYGVGSEAQYMFIRSLSDSPVLHFIVWDGKAYREITANRPGRRFGVDMHDYHL